MLSARQFGPHERKYRRDCAQPRLCSRRKIVPAVARRSATPRPLRWPTAVLQNASLWRRDCPDDARAASRLRAVPATPRSHGRSEEHTSELQSLMRISYAVFRLKQKKNHNETTKNRTLIN